MNVGCHVSTRSGLAGAVKAALAMGAGAFQYFAKNPRSYALKQVDERDAAQCAELCAKHNIRSIVHSAYPINLAVTGEEERTRMLASLWNDLLIAEACGSLGVVVHFGWTLEQDVIAAYQRIIAFLDELLQAWHGKALILLENQAGHKTMMGTSLIELATIRQQTAYAEKIGFCLDTCHLFVSGQWNGSNEAEWFAEGDKVGFFAGLRVIHVNDARYASGSTRDRHANIGDGQIGVSSLRRLLQLLSFKDMMYILETPAGKEGTHAEEILLLKQLLE